MEINSGLNALEALVNENDTAEGNSFTSLKSGDSKKVKVLGLGDVKDVYTYNAFKLFNTFVPKNPPKLSKRGFPVENLTPMDLAWQHHQNKSEDFGDDDSQEAGKYRIKQRFAFGLYDLDAKEMIVIDFTKNQAATLYTVLKKQADKLDKRAFELEKTGTGRHTTVSLTPEPLDDLTPEQAKAFEEAPKEFDHSLFEGLYFEQDNEQMTETLIAAGFDVNVIVNELTAMGVDLQSAKNGNSSKEAQPTIQADENPFAGQKTFDDLAAEDPTQQF